MHIRAGLVTFALSLRGRLFALICLATLPALLFTFYIADLERRNALRQAIDETQNIVNFISREHFYQISGAKSLLRWLTESMERGEKFDSNFLAALKSGYPQVANIAVLSPDGDVISSAFAFSGSLNMSNFSAVRRALRSTEFETGEYVVGPIVGKPLLHLSRAVRDKGGKPLWIVFVAIDLNWLKDLSEKIELPADRILLITDRNGIVLANSSSFQKSEYDPGVRIPELAGHNQFSRAVLEDQSVGLRQSFVSVPMEGVSGVFVASALPLDRVRRAADTIFVQKLSLLLMLTFFTVISVLFLEEVALLGFLRALSRASKRFGEGDYRSRAPIPRGYGELGNMARVFNDMAESLTLRHQQLLQAHERLNRLTRHLQIVRESESQRIARDLHDEIGQVLTSIKIDLCGFEGKRSEGSGFSCKSSIDGVLAKIDGLVKFVRQIASQLRPPVLDRIGVVSAIELLIRDSEQNTGIIADYRVLDVKEPLDWLLSITIYRIVQEALTNISRHAKASKVTIVLRQDEGKILLEINDDGAGFVYGDEFRNSLGIIGMQERAGLVGGSFELISAPGEGTSIRVEIPIDGTTEGTLLQNNDYKDYLDENFTG